MRRVSRTGILTALLLASLQVAAPAQDRPAPALAVVSPEDADWKRWASELAPKQDITADFEETRTFSFRREGVVLRGTTRISPQRGLSLEYLEPEARVVIIDAHGILLRERDGREKAGPSDPRGAAVNAAMLNILRFDLDALLRDFEVKGLRAGNNWTLELVPRSESLRRAVQRILVEGLGREVRRMLLQRSARQAVDIRITARERMQPFTDDELRRYFRTTE